MADDVETPPQDQPHPEDRGVIVIRLVLTHKEGAGLELRIEHEPNVYPDTIIDACLRAARVYTSINHLQLQGQQAQEALKSVRIARNLRGMMNPPRPS